MNRDQNNFERIEAYLNETSSAEERADFERQMEADPELKQEVSLHRSVHAELGDTDTLEFRKKLVKIGEEHKRQEKKRPFAWKVAAGLLVLVGLSAYLWLKPQTDDLFKNYYKPYPIEDIMRGDEATSGTVFQLYGQGEYRKALPEMEQLAKENPSNAALSLYLGNCYLNLDQEQKAISVFQSITKQSKYHEDAQWYLALAYIRLQNTEKTIERLRWVVDYDGLHKKTASELLHRITIENPDDF